jgi:hypothetical protein
MITEDGESIMSEVSINTDMRVFNGGIKDINTRLKRVNDDNKVKEIKKYENGLNDLAEPISFRPIVCDMINNFSIDIDKLNMQNECEMDENIFKNLKEKLEESEPYRNNEYNKFKSTNSNIINCTISSIEEGMAILVTQDDTIFSLPAFFLPKKSIPGNCYQICIDETVKMQSKVTNIFNLQKNFKSKMKKKNNLINI